MEDDYSCYRGPESESEVRTHTTLNIVKTEAYPRSLGLWNLFLSKSHYPKHGVALTNLEVC
jgi:acyl-CoA dehydrogenase